MALVGTGSSGGADGGAWRRSHPPVPGAALPVGTVQHRCRFPPWEAEGAKGLGPGALRSYLITPVQDGAIPPSVGEPGSLVQFTAAGVTVRMRCGRRSRGDIESILPGEGGLAGTGGPAAARCFHGPCRLKPSAAPGGSARLGGVFSLRRSLAGRPGPGAAGGRAEAPAGAGAAGWGFAVLFVSRHSRDSRLGQPPALDRIPSKPPAASPGPRRGGWQRIPAAGLRPSPPGPALPDGAGSPRRGGQLRAGGPAPGNGPRRDRSRRRLR